MQSHLRKTLSWTTRSTFVKLFFLAFRFLLSSSIPLMCWKPWTCPRNVWFSSTKKLWKNETGLATVDRWNWRTDTLRTVSRVLSDKWLLACDKIWERSSGLGPNARGNSNLKRWVTFSFIPEKVHFCKDIYQKAKELYSKALSFMVHTGEKALELSCYGKMGTKLHWSMGKYSEAKEYLEKHLP